MRPWRLRTGSVPIAAIITLALTLTLLPPPPVVRSQEGALPSPGGAAPGVQVLVEGRPVDYHRPPTVRDSGIYLPLRDTLRALGFEVSFLSRPRTLTASDGRDEIALRTHCSVALVNGDPLEFAARPRYAGGQLAAPLDFYATLFRADGDLDARRGLLLRLRRRRQAWRWQPPEVTDLGSAGASASVTNFVVPVRVDGRQVRVQVVHVSADTGLRPRVELGRDRVDGTEPLASIAARHGAAVAVTGGYFNPEDYAARNDLPTEPWVTLIRRGKVQHLGQLGGVIGFRGLQDSRVVPLRMRVEVVAGDLRLPADWVKGINHTPSDTSANAMYVYTPAYGSVLEQTEGTRVIARNGRVTAIRPDDAPVIIPRDGYVIALFGVLKQLAGEWFAPGKRVDYDFYFEDVRGCPVAWRPTEALGAGPILVEGGDPVTGGYRRQGFLQERILTAPARRVAVGLMPDHAVIIAAADGVRMAEMARIMDRLGARDALNLDGGASAGVWVTGRYLLEPGRNLNNALLFVPGERARERGPAD